MSRDVQDGIRPHKILTQAEYDENKRLIDAWTKTPEFKAAVARNILDISLEFEEVPTGVETELAPQLKLNTGMVREEPAGQ